MLTALGRLGARSAILRQALLVPALLVNLVLLVGWGDLVAFRDNYAAGLVVIAVATGLAIWVDARSLHGYLIWAIPVLDLIGIGSMSLTPDNGGIGALVVVPAIWLGADYLLRGAGATAAVAMLTVTVPNVLYVGTTPDVWSRALVLPLVAVAAAVAAASLKYLWVEQSLILANALAAEQHLRATQEAITATVDVGLVHLDLAGTYRSMNRRQSEFLALAYPDGHLGIVGQLGYVYGADRETPLTYDEMPTTRAMEGDPYVDYVIWIGPPGQGQRAVSVSSSPLIGDDGELTGAVLVYKDVTDLVSALRVRDDFVSTVSHELRTPLTSIMGYVDLVLDADVADAATVRRYLSVVQRNSDRLLSLVGDLLTTAQSEQGRMQLHRVPTPLSELVSSVLVAQAASTRRSGVELRGHIEPGAFVLGDADRLRRLIDNLVSNAVKYTPAGGAIQVSLAGRGEALELVVRDSGIGLDADELERVFDRFYRSREAHRRAIQGVGLGLTIVRSIVEAHGGTVSAESEVGRGSTFTVTLPRLRVPVSAGHASSVSSSLVAAEPGRTGSITPTPRKPKRS